MQTEHCEDCGDILDTTILPNGYAYCECATCEATFTVDDQGFRTDEE